MLTISDALRVSHQGNPGTTYTGLSLTESPDGCSVRQTGMLSAGMSAFPCGRRTLGVNPVIWARIAQ